MRKRFPIKTQLSKLLIAEEASNELTIEFCSEKSSSFSHLGTNHLKISMCHRMHCVLQCCQSQTESMKISYMISIRQNKVKISVRPHSNHYNYATVLAMPHKSQNYFYFSMVYGIHLSNKFLRKIIIFLYVLDSQKLVSFIYRNVSLYNPISYS